ncbi:M949_RS01915 family surface polysaccharide biosynthesis protein [Aquimarina aquimarini]|uniref:M949_RS01915 family surface polysaccharide biosynthesis protein n=1 Tax=Aquimarina aquimarini TaxID=1191734 RepID=UPI000D5618C0|nr:hypothetical protein [Aquimarina aquimarini]
MIKKITLITAVSLIFNLATCQTTEEKENQLEAELKLEITDTKNSIKTTSLIYDEIPKSLNFRGTVVESLKWKDALGENILIFTLSGSFDWKEYYKSGSQKYDIQDKSELYVYLFQKRSNQNQFQMKWRMYDYTKCFGVDMYTGFIKKAATITDLDKDGISEVSIPYVLICRGGMDPGTMKIIMYEDDTKYALRGETAICKQKEVMYGGTYKASESLKTNRIFNEYLEKRWEMHKCEKLN